MTVETKPEKSRKNASRKNASRKNASRDWAPKARRYGERGDWPEAQAQRKADDQLPFPSTSAPPIWPRVFPGI